MSAVATGLGMAVAVRRRAGEGGGLRHGRRRLGRSALLRSDPFVWTPRLKPPLRLDPGLILSCSYYKTRLGKPSSGRWEEGKEGENPWRTQSVNTGTEYEIHIHIRSRRSTRASCPGVQAASSKHQDQGMDLSSIHQHATYNTYRLQLSVPLTSQGTQQREVELQAAGYKLQAASYRLQAAGCKLQSAG